MSPKTLQQHSGRRFLPVDLVLLRAAIRATIRHRTAFLGPPLRDFPVARRTVARRGLEVLPKFLIFSGQILARLYE
jgi:hypothetical protein